MRSLHSRCSLRVSYKLLGDGAYVRSSLCFYQPEVKDQRSRDCKCKLPMSKVPVSDTSQNHLLYKGPPNHLLAMIVQLAQMKESFSVCSAGDLPSLPLAWHLTESLSKTKCSFRRLPQIPSDRGRKGTLPPINIEPDRVLEGHFLLQGPPCQVWGKNAYPK